MTKQGLKNVLLSAGLGLSLILTEFIPAGFSEERSVLQKGLGVQGIGTENRKWVTEKQTLNSERYPISMEENIEIEVRDGTVLRGRLLTPAGTDKPLPTIVQLNGYGHGHYGNSSEKMLIDLAERGYAVLHVSMRGSGTSDGEPGLYNFYGQDGYDVIEWAAGQPWSNGKVGTVGLSLLGISQWLAAKELPPSLKAISPIMACTNCYDTLWNPSGMESGPGRIARGFEYGVASEHRDYDDWWQQRSLSTEELKAVAKHGIASLISAGWNDYISPGSIEAYKLYSSAGGPSKLIVSQEAHAYLSDVMPYEFEDYQALWFDYYLKGTENGIEEREPVLIYVQGAGQWRYEPAWPLTDTNYVNLFFNDKKSSTISSTNDGSFEAKAPEKNGSSVVYTYSPETGPFTPSLLSSSGRLQIDQQPYEEKTVTWTTDALAVPTEVTGNMKTTFWAEVDAVDADFIVQVTDVSPDGTSKQVAAGYLNASRAKSLTDPVPLVPGEINDYTVELLPTSYVFKKGHRIRISISGGAKALKGQKAPQGPGIHPISSSVRIYQDATYPSSLTLPLIGVSELMTTKADNYAF